MARCSRCVAPALLLVLLAGVLPPAGAQGRDHAVAGGQVSVTAAVAGDLLAAGGEVDVATQIGGDAAVAGGSVRLDGAIADDLYAAAGRLAVHGAVNGNARLAAGNLDIGERAKIAGNVSVAGGEVRIRGAVGGYLQATGGDVLIDGPVEGDVEVAAGELELGPNARIKGRLRYTSGEEVERAPGAQVQGGIERFGPAPRGEMAEGAAHGLAWLWTAGLLILAAVLAALAPGLYADAAVTARTRWGWALLVGLIALICIPVLALIAAITVVGLPLALVAILLFLALPVLGYVSTGISAGALALQRFQPSRAPRAGWRVVAAVLGMLVLGLVARVPGLGWLVMVLAVLLGVGVLLMQLWQRVRQA